MSKDPDKILEMLKGMEAARDHIENEITELVIYSNVISPNEAKIMSASERKRYYNLIVKKNRYESGTQEEEQI